MFRDKSNYILVAATAILILSSYNAIDDLIEDSRDEAFYASMTEFMNRGDRNTASMGYEMCVVQNAQNRILGMVGRDCCRIYFPSKVRCDE